MDATAVAAATKHATHKEATKRWAG